MATVQRDVYNPLLFEIAWEVANKGKLFFFYLYILLRIPFYNIYVKKANL